MHLTAIAEQFNKLKQSYADDILNAFNDGDIKGIRINETLFYLEYYGKKQ